MTYPENRSTQNAVLIMTDVLGFEFPNVQLYYASPLDGLKS